MADEWMYEPTERSNAEPSPSDAAAQTSVARESTSHDSKQTPRVRRRNRLINSCLECRRRKLKCDKLAPCTNCARFKRDCLYLAPSLDSQSQQKLADLKEKMGALEKNLEREVASRTQKAHLGGVDDFARADHNGPGDAEDAEELAEEEDVLEPTPFTSLDNVYEDNADDELVDLGVQMGKMRITERIGGFIRPKMAQELQETLRYGSQSQAASSPTGEDQPRLRPSPHYGRSRQGRSCSSYIGPGPDYIAPASGIFFPGTNLNTSLLDYLPSKSAADQLVAQYFRAVHYMCRCVHRPTFEAQYTLFWGQIATGTEPAPPVQAIILAAMFSAAVSLTEQEVLQNFGATRTSLVDSLRSGTEYALAKANFLRTTKLNTIQAFIMYLIPQIRMEVSRAHSALVGTVIRLAECMGLHRDGTNYSMPPIEVHVRRLLWYQLCFLDMRTVEATGPFPQIRRDDYDTQMPLNIDDSDLLERQPPKEDKPYWTDMTLFRMRMEWVMLRRQLWFDMPQIDRKKKSLTSTVVKVKKAKTDLEAKYFPMLDESIPVHVFAKHVMTVGLAGCFIQILHRYLFRTTQTMPDRLRQLLLEAALTQMQNAIAIETKPELIPWCWYKGALQQYHAALLTLVEVRMYPMRRDAADIWKCLDYIFDIPENLSPMQKAELVLTDLRDRMEMYHQTRKMRSTNQMEEKVSSIIGSGPTYPSPEDAETEKAGKMAMVPSGTLPPVSFSPPPAAPSDSASSGRQASVDSTADASLQMMEDIDWAEWNKYFPMDENSGDLNIPDFNLADFTGGSAGSPLEIPSWTGAATQSMMIPSLQDLASMRFTTATYPDMDIVEKARQNYGRK